MRYKQQSREDSGRVKAMSWEGPRVGMWCINSIREKQARGQMCVKKRLKTSKWKERGKEGREGWREEGRAGKTID